MYRIVLLDVAIVLLVYLFNKMVARFRRFPEGLTIAEICILSLLLGVRDTISQEFGEPTGSPYIAMIIGLAVVSLSLLIQIVFEKIRKKRR